MSMVHNRFEVTQILGRGAEAPVVLARDRALAGRLVALKDLSAAAADEVARAQREYRLFADLAHPHLARLLDYGVAGSAGAYLAYEYVPGRALEEARDLPVDGVADCAAQALRALAFLHAKGIFHGDLSPTNLRLTPSDRLKLIDFGLARPLGSIQPGGGTPPYLAPERRHEGAVDATADLFSLGAVLYRILAGDAPFPIADGGRIEYERIRPLSELRPDLPPALADWVHGLLCPEPAGRPPSARIARSRARTDGVFFSAWKGGSL